MLPEHIKGKLDNLYNRYNKRRFVHPDPLEFLYLYKDIRDREIVGLIASSLAYGRVAQILKSVSFVLEVMHPSPYLFIMDSTVKTIRRAFEGFTHRFADGDQLAALLLGARKVVRQFGSLNKCFVKGMSPEDETVFPAMTFFAKHLIAEENRTGHLIPLPERGSACKRMNLFLRWMARKDQVDPGGWVEVPLYKLIVPLDTHMHKISLELGFTRQKQANMGTALEITSGFKQYAPDDPVKYDFVLTRLGIRGDMDMDLICN